MQIEITSKDVAKAIAQQIEQATSHVPAAAVTAQKH